MTGGPTARRAAGFPPPSLLGPAARRSARGFTLIEVLVALTIAAVALMAALRATGSLAQSSEDLRLRTLAQWSAENRLAALRVQGVLPQVGQTRYDCSQADVPLTCQQDVYSMNSRFFRRVELSVFGGRPEQRLARLVGFPGEFQ